MLIPAITVLVLGTSTVGLQADTRWIPSIDITGIQDDNIRFSRNDPKDDTIYIVEPALKLSHRQELNTISAEGRVIVRRYQENDELDDEIYRLTLAGDSKMTERFRLNGGYQFTKDTTLDSELEETGRIFVREDRTSHRATIAPEFNLNERTSVGLAGRYRVVNYDAEDNVDYTSWDVGLPIRYRMETQIDSVYINPSYTYRDSDANRSTTYNLRLGWDHESTERLTVKLSFGARLTEHERLSTGEKEEIWSGLGDLKFVYDIETGRFTIDFRHDLRNAADGDQVEVSRVILGVRWKLTERLGVKLKGSYYYTQTEGQIDDDTSEFVRAGSEIFYNLTETHIAFIAYDYSQENLKDVQDDPRTERNRIWAGISFNFPL